jgi:predicted N-acyltransferase
MKNLSVEFVDSIEDIGQHPWNNITGVDNPFTRYEFLHALEVSGCTTQQSGWQPHHVAVYEQTASPPTGDETPSPKTLIALVPLYLKTNSWGEYVFDWSWANAYQSHGLDYYPKFVTAVPFTPSVGKRFFIEKEFAAKSSDNENELITLVAEKVKHKAQLIGASSWHVLFPTPQQDTALTDARLLPRIATQFHWTNRDYKHFDDFLNQLTSRKRKSIRKERAKVSEQAITFKRTEGANITDQQWSDFYQFYQSTYMMRGQQGYLNLSFFLQLAKAMPEQILLINAQQNGRDIAAALCFKNSEKLFGRYWGSAADFQFLHFETCYYQGQEYAIEHGLKSFDSGAQGEHKIQRGFEPIITHSNHWIAHPSFSDAIEKFLFEERPHILAYMKSAQALLPFKEQQS